MSKSPVSDPEIARNLVADAFAQRKIDMKKFSVDTLGRNHAYMFQYINQGKPLVLPEDVRAEVSKATGIPEDKLKVARKARAPRETASPNARIGPRVPLGGTRAPRIPVYGQAVGGADGRFVFNGQKVADALTPPALVGVPDAYAVYVDGKSMEPRYYAGETAYVHPYLRVKKGDFVIVQINGDEGDPPMGYVKLFVSMDDRRIKLQQLNPKKTLTFPRKAVVSVHRIVLAG